MTTRHRRRERIDASLAQLHEDIAKREMDSVRRDKQQLPAIAGLIGLATAILGVMIAQS